MTKITAQKHPLETILEYCNYNLFAYSGKGMFGHKCMGAALNMAKPHDLFADIISMLGEQAVILNAKDNANTNGVADCQELFKQVSQAFKGMRQDSLGQDIIIYFPNIDFVK